MTGGLRAAHAWAQLLRAHAITRRQDARLQAEHGLSANDYQTLELLSRLDGHCAKQAVLGRELQLTPSGVTRLLAGLERDGFVERVASPTDRRATFTRLTDAGAARLAEASRGYAGSIRSLLEEHFSDTQLEELAELLSKLPGLAD